MNELNKNFTLLYKNDDFLVINKAEGVVSQGADSDCNLIASIKKVLGLEKVLPVHRLDKGTSGVMVYALSDEANKQLSQQFQQGQVEKYYLALTSRKGKKKQGLVKGDMQKGRAGNWMLLPTKTNPAITYFHSFGFVDGIRFNIVKPMSGKTHQIRVALKSLACPILGDVRYGGDQADRLYLHALSLTFSFGSDRFKFFDLPNTGKYFERTLTDEKLKSIGSLEDLSWPKVD